MKCIGTEAHAVTHLSTETYAHAVSYTKTNAKTYAIANSTPTASHEDSDNHYK